MYCMYKKYKVILLTDAAYAIARGARSRLGTA